MPKKTELSGEDKRLRHLIGARVRELSASRGLKPQDVADITGVSLAHQYRVENGETTPDALYLFKLARRLNISMDGFFQKSHASDLDLTDRASSLAMPSSISVHGNSNALAIGSGATIQTSIPRVRPTRPKKTE